MDSRERVKTALRFETPDRLPANESPWEQTAAAWYDQGIPRDMSLADYFGFDISMMFLDTSPRFEMKVLGREDGNITYEDRFGYTITKPDGVSATMHFRRHVTTDRETWDGIKPRFALRFDPDEPARIDDKMYFGHFDPYPTWDEAVAKYHRIRTADRYLLFMFYGPWEATWRHRGMEDLLMDVATDPDWVRDMAEAYQSLVIDVLQRCVDLGIKPDGILTRTSRNHGGVAKLAKSFGGIGIGAQLAESLGDFRYERLISCHFAQKLIGNCLTADDLGSAHGPLLSPQMWGDISIRTIPVHLMSRSGDTGGYSKPPGPFSRNGRRTDRRRQKQT